MMWATLVNLRNSKNVKTCKHIFFYAAYILYFVSWCFGDLAPGLSWLPLLEKTMRYASYLFMLFCLLVIQRDRKEWITFFLMEAVGVYYFLVSKELYIISLVLLIMISTDEDVITIFKASLAMLCVIVITTLALCMMGVLENIVTVRSSSDLNSRYSLGFYHSNVLPLMLFYIIAYLGVIQNLKLNKWVLLALTAIVVTVFIVCNSRICFIMTLILIGLCAIYPRLSITRRTENMIYRVCRTAILSLSILTMVLVLLYPMNIKLIQHLNSALSGRLVYSFKKALNYGIQFINPISAADYLSDGIVLDNAYISAIIRYGWISVALLGTINYYCCEKYKKYCGALLIFFCVCLVNFVDNDLLTYSCFPFLLAAFNKKKLLASATETVDHNELISVIMSTYNETEQQLSASIRSILHQSYANLEFIIVNDNPNNGDLRAILAKYAQEDSRIVLVENPQNIGLVNSLNRAISYTHGRYIARMDADDIATVNRLSRQLSYLKNNELDFVGGQIHFIDEESNSLKYTMKIPTLHDQIRRGMRWGGCIPHPTWLLKREVYEVLGGYRQIPHCEDYDFILRALKVGFRVGNVPFVVLNYRIRTTGISVSNSLEQNLIRNYLAANMQDICLITEDMVMQQKDNQRNPYYLFNAKKTVLKDAIKSRNPLIIGRSMCLLIVNRYFWFWLVEKARYHIYQ